MLIIEIRITVFKITFKIPPPPYEKCIAHAGVTYSIIQPSGHLKENNLFLHIVQRILKTKIWLKRKV